MNFQGFNDYRVEVYKGDKMLGAFGYVTNVHLLTYWLNIHFLYWRWTSIKVYHRIEGELIGEYQRGSEVPAKPGT